MDHHVLLYLLRINCDVVRITRIAICKFLTTFADGVQFEVARQLFPALDPVRLNNGARIKINNWSAFTHSMFRLPVALGVHET